MFNVSYSFPFSFAVGFTRTLYSIMAFRLLFVNFRRYRKTKDKKYLVYASFAVIFIFYNFFYVFYKDMWLTAFFMLVAAESENYYYVTLLSRKQNIIK